jgi:sigma-B regulation protein RsbU (phosphoserine phosphatase)
MTFSGGVSIEAGDKGMKTLHVSRGLALKLTLLVLASVGLIFSAVFIYNYEISRRIITRNLEQNARNLALATVNRIDTVLRGVEKVPQNIAVFMESLDPDDRTIRKMLHSVVKDNWEISGATIAFEPWARGPGKEKFALCAYKKGNKIDFTRFAYDYRYRDWYQIPRELGRPVWSEPYYGAVDFNALMSPYSVPFYRQDKGVRKLAGIVAADISLAWLQQTASAIKIAQTGYAFLITKNGTFLTHPAHELIMNETIFSVAAARGEPRVRELGRRMIRGGSGYIPFKSIHTGKDCWLVYEPLPSNGWSLGVLFPRQELMADVGRLNRTVIMLGLGGFLVILVVIILIAGSITRPLRALSQTAEQIADGNLDAELPPIKTRDEVGRLSDSFHHMQVALKKYIKDLSETIASKERIESELKIAHDIQMGILPKVFPPFPDRSEFDIRAVLKPAREVGGDFYDFFFMDRDHLCIAIGDVSDKGVPAALFMSMTKTMIQAKSSRGMTSREIVAALQEELVSNNPSMMFVTLFLAILDTRTGLLEYCNAGHNPPYVMRASGAVIRLDLTGGVALGVVDDFVYESRKIRLSDGDAVLLYTDGVTEAMNEGGALYSEARLEKLLARLGPGAGEGLLEEIMAALGEFSSGAAQSDDITMVHLSYFGSAADRS